MLATLEHRARTAPALRRISMFVGALMAGILGGSIGAGAGSGSGTTVVIAIGVLFAIQVVFAFRAARQVE